MVGEDTFFEMVRQGRQRSPIYHTHKFVIIISQLGTSLSKIRYGKNENSLKCCGDFYVKFLQLIQIEAHKDITQRISHLETLE